MGIDRGVDTKNQQECCSRWSYAKFVYPIRFAGFCRLQQHYKLLEGSCHFCGFGSARCLSLTSCRECSIGWGALGVPTVSFRLFTERLRPISCYTFRCGPTVREQAKSKVWSRKTTLLSMPIGTGRDYHKSEDISTEEVKSVKMGNRVLRIVVSILCICAVVNGIAIIKLGRCIKTIEGLITNMVAVDETLIDSVQTITGILNLEG